ncbi:adenosylcobinamide-phosphate guanylyltransferase [Natrialba magadii ATCC 43099]|uniref:4-diphosphocytidyl-2C-methyl-D-erythritol synthase n=1 Tax=Natrialba magadii (strain ATCC 43099 / DSM 3394 / CCM 3739 / CIP 104546 / IAM 13178 / JCM 8861 / NBRC 102185 / NCIMB 2190 / MS3) TaxID=547559 RepID=D3SQT5_NATMM|nr:NTP transferase domain-containing protein [Natrialba magadii]ADD04573.1 adenosylcobinamide-phosphate guanylyltransferase [Natrialba magadii ATCC 43099]ELY25230.1 4-diphosphocytidyl-2C-methyl-D-erythritol synthase [Natrialba magadii ATCC 43099]
MCGGKGTRLESDHEKPLHPIAGVPMVDRVVGALESSQIETIYAAVSPNAPKTHAHLSESDRDVNLVETAGEGYVADLLTTLDRPEISQPLLTVAADLPLLSAAAVDQVVTAYDERGGAGSMTICIPEARKRELGVSIDSRLEQADHDAGTASDDTALVPTGVNVVGESTADDTTDQDTTDDTQPSMTYVTDDPRLAVNVNQREDARIATAYIRDPETRAMRETKEAHETHETHETDGRHGDKQ